jgi:1-acyl-sn-glycerol-3-phosphate acyltransferase
MLQRLSRIARIVTTGASFALFGVLGGALGLTLYPAVRYCAPDPHVGELRVQRLVHWTFRGFSRVMKLLRVAKVRVLGAEGLLRPGALLIVANHPTLLDVVMLGGLLPQLDCVVKREAWSNPFMRGVVRSAGYIPNDPGEAVLDACCERLRQGRHVLMFPEGTRSPKGGLGPFQRGAAHVAIASGATVLPVVIRCEPPSLMRGQKWYDVPERRRQFTIEVGDALDLQQWARADSPRASSAREINRALRDFYEKRLQTLPA